jgi:hypothetical protein
MNRDVWRLVDAIPPVLRAEAGLTDDQLAGRLGAPARDIRAAVAILYSQGRVDRCWTGTEAYVVLPPHPAEAGAVA